MAPLCQDSCREPTALPPRVNPGRDGAQRITTRMSSEYTVSFKEAMVQKMSGPGGMTAGVTFT